MKRTQDTGKKPGRALKGPAWFFLSKLEQIANDPMVRSLYDASCKAGVKAYLVGGLLRDMAMGAVPSLDYDFAVDGNAGAVAVEAARILGARAFVLDKATKTHRIALRRDADMVTLDVAPLRGGGISSDLLSRDYTVDAMAVDLDALFSGRHKEAFIDTLSGLKDCFDKVLRRAADNAFDEDPLRVIRGVRLSAVFGFRIEDSTLDLIGRKSALLGRCAKERVREEFLRIMDAPNAHKSVRLMLKTGIMDSVLPVLSSWGDVLGYDLLSHSLKTLEETEAGIAAFKTDVRYPLKAHFEERLGSVNKAVILKLCALLHDAGKPLTIERSSGALTFRGHDERGADEARLLLKRLRFSKKVVDRTRLLVRNHHRLFNLAKLQDPKERAFSHFFRAMGGEAGLDLLILARADVVATSGGMDPRVAAVIDKSLDYYYSSYVRKSQRPLLTGREVMALLSIPECRLVGDKLREVAMAVEEGRVRTKREAIALICPKNRSKRVGKGRN